MPEQHSSFTFDYLDYKLRERLEEALLHINTLSKDDVLRCDNECLQKLVARFTIAPLILRSEKRAIDEKTFELVDHTFDRKTGDTGHRVLIPVEGDPEWLVEIDSQKAPVDGHPLAFLDKERRQIYINLRLSLSDEDGGLTQDVNYRMQLAEQYVMAVAEKLATFNSELAVKMKQDLARRREAILKAKRARDLLGLPEVNNPRNQETAEKMERLREELMKRMSGETKNVQSSGEPALEIAHVLFMDIVGYSKLPIDKQTAALRLLQETVQKTKDFVSGIKSNRLISLPTGDGMALAFFGDPLAPARCAIELSRLIRNSPELPLRMGLSSGPTYHIKDINTNPNLAGDGINIAQRVMDCGDAGHILLSKRVADDLLCVSGWSDYLLDLGEVEVKHGKRIHIFNLCGSDFGNAEQPTKTRS
jgi:class 3 adenylate cyclase